jgi:hypothetical protein
MKSHLMLAMLSLAAVVGASAQTAAPALVVWAANPMGPQPMPNAPALALLPWSGAIPLKVSDGGKCLLVARRGPQIVAIELSPLIDGPRLVGWVPKEIDMDTATSQWGYVAPKWSSDQAKFTNPATASITASNKTVVRKSAAPAGYSSASSWSNPNVEAHGKAAVGSESRETVTINGRTYRKYSQFKAASTEVPMAVSDEYICQ